MNINMLKSLKDHNDGNSPITIDGTYFVSEVFWPCARLSRNKLYFQCFLRTYARAVTMGETNVRAPMQTFM